MWTYGNHLSTYHHISGQRVSKLCFLYNMCGTICHLHAYSMLNYDKDALKTVPTHVADSNFSGFTPLSNIYSLTREIISLKSIRLKDRKSSSYLALCPQTFRQSWWIQGRVCSDQLGWLIKTHKSFPEYRTSCFMGTYVLDVANQVSVDKLELCVRKGGDKNKQVAWTLTTELAASG